MHLGIKVIDGVSADTGKAGVRVLVAVWGLGGTDMTSPVGRLRHEGCVVDLYRAYGLFIRTFRMQVLCQDSVRSTAYIRGFCPNPNCSVRSTAYIRGVCPNPNCSVRSTAYISLQRECTTDPYKYTNNHQRAAWEAHSYLLLQKSS